MSSEYCENLKKIELHAHLNGSLSVKTIGRLVRLHKQNFPEEQVPSASDIFKTATTFNDAYSIFALAQQLVDHPDAVKLAAKNVLNEFCEENVAYVELRSTPRSCPGKMSKREYLMALIETIQEVNDIHAGLLVSIDRRKSVEEADENVELAIELHKLYPNIVLGCDLSGDARVNDLKDYIPFLQKSSLNGLKVSLHFAEVANESEVSFILNHDTFKPDRMGHCTFIHPNLGGTLPNWNKFQELKIPSEICLTSNVQCKSVSSYEDHHLQHIYDENLPFCICTDDKGVFNCSSTSEYLKAMEILKLTPEEMFDVSFKAIDHIFANESIKNLLRSKFLEWKLQLDK